jgi:hypothetical protein
MINISGVKQLIDHGPGGGITRSRSSVLGQVD